MRLLEPHVRLLATLEKMVTPPPFQEVDFVVTDG